LKGLAQATNVLRQAQDIRGGQPRALIVLSMVGKNYRLTQDMTAGFVVSKAAWLYGRSCTHLAFSKPGIDIQIWIDNGAQPLPVKYVLTTTDLISAPQYVLTLSDWNTSPKIDANTFRFAPPAGAKRIEFVPANVVPAPAK
jgi:hypothetical protein